MAYLGTFVIKNEDGNADALYRCEVLNEDFCEDELLVNAENMEQDIQGEKIQQEAPSPIICVNCIRVQLAAMFANKD